jgi:hypothetical protein
LFIVAIHFADALEVSFQARVANAELLALAEISCQLQ